MILIRKIIYTTLIFFILQSCIEEDLSHCTSNNIEKKIRIYLAYQPKSLQNKAIDPSDIKSLSLFVFNKEGKFVISKQEVNVTLNNDYYIEIQLLPEIYSFVIWGNMKNPYFTIPASFEENISDLSTALLYFKRPNSNIVTTQIPNLYFAQKTNTIITSDIIQKVYLPLIQNTNNINLTVKGLKNNNDNYSYKITDNNSKYYFDNRFAPDSYFSYLTSNILDSNLEFKASLRVLKLAKSRSVLLEVINETRNKLVYQHDLIDLLNRLEDQHPGIDWSNINDFNIVVNLKPNLDIEITINGWNVITDDVQLP